MDKKMTKLISWAKRRGFIFQSSEIYGGLAGVYDLGPYGVELKNNLKRFWWKRFVQDRDDVVGIESSILMNREVWRASGHEKGFVDLLAECQSCHKRFKKDELMNKTKCPECKGKIIGARKFNLMFRTFAGSTEEDATMTYLRPETAQGMFINFKNILNTQRVRLPFGLAQIGKSFRNEITPKDYLYRVREFEIAEIEYFINPENDKKWFDYWFSEWQKFYLDLGIKKQNLKLHEHSKNDLAHYSKRTVDLLYKFPFGEKELAGVANRTDYDLSQHQKFSGRDLQYFDEENGKKFIPYVIEPTLGIERAVLAILLDAFEIVKGGRTKTTEATKEEEVVLKLSPTLAPVKVTVLPLIKKLSKETRNVFDLIKNDFVCQYDEDGSIGRRYRRQDEIGTPLCITIDFETLKDKTVTLRNRDTMSQKRVKISQLKEELNEELEK